MKKYYWGTLTLFILLSFFFNLLLSPSVLTVEATEIRDIFFPTKHSATLTDSFGDARYGHAHEGSDIIGEKMMPLYAAIDGRVSYLVNPEANYGYALTLKDSVGYTYHYLHVNNDTPGTDDGQGGTKNAYAPGIVRGAKVVRGQLIGWMGDSGNAESVGAHLHFEIRKPGGTAIDAYPSLVEALYPGSYNVAEAMEASPNINIDKSLTTILSEAPCESGSLIKLAGSQAVYYCGADAKRYVFVNDKVYFSWYNDFAQVTVLTPEEMASIPLGGNVTYRPGIKMVKIQTNPKVYAVERGGKLRHIQAAETAEALYGEDWNTKIDDIPDAFFFSYTIGQPILSARDENS